LFQGIAWCYIKLDLTNHQNILTLQLRCLAAKELGIEKLWVWVFDLTDEQADTARVEMEA
jgi:hypothetical protein